VSCAGGAGVAIASSALAGCSVEVNPSEAPSISVFLPVAGVTKDFLHFRCCIFRHLHPPRHPEIRHNPISPAACLIVTILVTNTGLSKRLRSERQRQL